MPAQPRQPPPRRRRPGHPRTVQAPETQLDQISADFFARHVFGPERAALLAAQLPATDADAAARDAIKATLRIKLKQNTAAKNAQIIALEQLPADPADDTANEMRARIRDRFAQLHTGGQQLQAQLDTLDQATPHAADTTLLDQLPLVDDILPGLPPHLKAELFDVFDYHIL